MSQKIRATPYLWKIHFEKNHRRVRIDLSPLGFFKVKLRFLIYWETKCILLYIFSKIEKSLVFWNWQKPNRKFKCGRTRAIQKWRTSILCKIYYPPILNIFWFFFFNRSVISLSSKILSEYFLMISLVRNNKKYLFWEFFSTKLAYMICHWVWSILPYWVCFTEDFLSPIFSPYL